MASTYSTNLKIELQATGENPGTWGTITNTNLGTALEQAIVGYGNPSYASDANLTLTYTNTNAAQTARSLVLNVTSAVSLTATRELVVPTIQKQYIVQNNTTGAQSITVKTSAGTGITVPNGRKAHLYVDGTNVIQMFDFVDINGGAIDGVTLGTSSAVTEAQIDNINLNGNTISSTDTNGNLILAPNGTGDVQVNADTLRVGDSNVDATITTNGTGDLILNTNSGSSSGSIRIYDGANGDIEVTASGTGSFNVAPNMLVGTTTDFTSTGAAGGMAVSGYGIYPWTVYAVSSPSGTTNNGVNTGIVVQNAALSLSGASSGSIFGIASDPLAENSGTGLIWMVGIRSNPTITSSGSNARILLYGGEFDAVRESALDTSSHANNATYGIVVRSGVDGVAGTSSSNSSTSTGAFVSTYIGSGTSTLLRGIYSALEATYSSTDRATTVTNASAYQGRLRFGKTSGADTVSVTNAYGFYLDELTVRSTATVTNYYALFAAAPTVTGTLTNRWGVYIADASSPNYFAGSVQVGAGTAAAPTLTTIADTNTGVFFPAADVVGVSTGGTERMRVDSAGNLLVGTTTGFTSTGAAGGVAVAGYGIYPYTTYSASSPSGLVNTINTVSTVFAPSASFSGATSSSYYGLVSLPSVSATGAGGTGGTFLYSLYASPQLSSSGASARISVGGIYISSVRASSSDASSNASNAVVGVFSAAGIEGTVSSGASATEIIGFTSNAYSGSGTSTQVYGYRSSVEATSVGTDQNTTITNVAAYAVSRIRLGLTSGATSTVTNLYGVNITGVDVRATATVNNYYAFFAAAPTVTGTLTNRWGVYIADASSPNYFAGSVQVGAGTAAAPTLTTIADTNTGVFFPAADVIGVSTGGTERARITSNGNLLVGTTTDFTSTGAAGGMAVSGYGIYPTVDVYGVTNTSVNSSISLQNTPINHDGASSLSYDALSIIPAFSNSGAGGTSFISVSGINVVPLVQSSGTNARISIGAGNYLAIRGSSNDLSSNASNFTRAIAGAAGLDGRVGASASSATIQGAFFSAFSGRGTSTTVNGTQSVVEATYESVDKSAVITNASAYHARLRFGKTSGTDTATVTNAYGFYIEPTNVRTTATVTNYYALFAAAPTVTGTLTNRWGVYIADASSPNYFAGSVQVGAGTAAAPTLTTIADTNTGVFFPAADVVGVSTNGTERARVKSTGQVRFVPLSADPAGAEAGDVYYNSTTNKLKVYNGSAWVDLH